MTSSEDKQPEKLPTASPASEAREQAAAYDSLFSNWEMELGKGKGKLSIPPHPDFGMLDDDVADAYNELQFERETSYERHEDIFIPEQRMKDPKTGNETGVVMPSMTQPGALKTPYRWADEGNDIFGEHHDKGQLVKPNWNTRIVRLILGDEDYRKLRDAGKSASDVWKVWSKQALESQERQFRRSQTDGGAVAVAPVPPPDSQ